MSENTRTWTILAGRTKKKKEHIVHLSKPAWAVITGRLNGSYVFATARANTFKHSGCRNETSTSSAAFADGDYMI